MTLQPGEPEGRREALALLYQGFFTGIVRIQSGRQPISNSDAFRRRMREALSEVQREAIRRGYAAEHTMETDFAIVAFLDEVILTSADPCRDEWAQKPLQDDLFGVSVAGEMFYARLEKLLSRQDTPELADMLEVYYLCLLLGFEGKYAIGGKADLHVLMDRLRQRIERIRRPSMALSPMGGLPREHIQQAAADPMVRTLKLAAVAASGFAFFCLLSFSAHLIWKSGGLREILTKSLLL